MNYYPGCTLKTKAVRLDAAARKAAAALGVELAELPEWQCCGAVYPLARDEIATKLSAVRSLAAARDDASGGGSLVTLCSACHHVLKRVNNDMASDDLIRQRANTYLALEKPYAGETRVVHYLEMLRDGVGFGEIAKRVVKPLAGKKIAAYYGCMLLRPSGEMRFDNPENPTIMEDFITALGGTPVPFARRVQCCGGYVALENAGMAESRVESVLSGAKKDGAELIVTACPLCLYNLRENAAGTALPVAYITEVLAEALGVWDAVDAGRDALCTAK
jgi:heterodisulfide reductase subunit B